MRFEATLPGRASQLPHVLLVVSIIAASAAFKVAWFLSGRLGFDSDQAVAGIGALRILRRGVHHVVCPGQDYGADLLAEYFALLHLFFQPSIALLRLGMIPFSLLLCVGVYFLARALYRDAWAAIVALAIVAFPPSMPGDWFMRSSSFAVVTLVVMTFALRQFWVIVAGAGRGVSSVRLFALGLLCGVAYWIYPAAAIVMAGMAVYLLFYPRLLAQLAGMRSFSWSGLREERLQVAFVASLLLFTIVLVTGRVSGSPSGFTRIGVLLLLGAVTAVIAAGRVLTLYLRRDEWWRLRPIAAFAGLWLGALPYIIYLWVHGRFVLVDTAPYNFYGAWLSFTNVFTVSIPILFGFFHAFALEPRHVPAALRWAAFATVLLTIIAVGARAIAVRRRTSAVPSADMLLLCLFAAQFLAFTLTRFGQVANEPRYLLLLYVVGALCVGRVVQLLKTRGALAPALLLPLGLIAFNMATCFDLPQQPSRRGSSTGQAHRSFDQLVAKGITHVSTRFSSNAYWLAYRNTYLADESVIFAPGPTPRGIYNRSEYYEQRVRTAPKVAYLITTAEARPLRQFLTKRFVQFKVLPLGSWRIFYDIQPDILRALSRADLMREAEKAN